MTNLTNSYPPSDKNLNYEIDDTVYWFSTAFEALSNWSAHAVGVWGEKFPTVEHAFHYRKFKETAPDIAAEIKAAPSPWKTLQLAKEYKSKRRQDWNDIKVGIMTEIIRAKMMQNEDARAVLLATGSKEIVENSPWDTFWGCGEDGSGENWTGRVLTQVRDELNTY